MMSVLMNNNSIKVTGLSSTFYNVAKLAYTKQACILLHYQSVTAGKKLVVKRTVYSKGMLWDLWITKNMVQNTSHIIDVDIEDLRAQANTSMPASYIANYIY